MTHLCAGVCHPHQEMISRNIFAMAATNIHASSPPRRTGTKAFENCVSCHRSARDEGGKGDDEIRMEFDKRLIRTMLRLRWELEYTPHCCEKR